ncbi:MAG: cytochrome c assembly protein [Saprospirales bacterium]|nr:cytochrome c assembly protein [Saprospirales bacterium]
MEQIQYIGEHLWPGRIGHFCIVLGFVAAILSAVAYAMGTRNDAAGKGWLRMGRTAFIVHGISILTVMGTILWAMINQYFEYQYVWQHVSEDLPMKYIFSAFWEGQEGSFMLWMFWHIILGFVLIWRAGKWEAPVIAVIAAVEVFINSMILGIYITPDMKIGSNPLLLLRDTMDIPLFYNADYLQLIQGNGLNPLLQNYWMTIHPPTLFLGFASTVVPFAYAIAGLWTKQYKEWLRPAMPWALFSGGILGLGILMGGAWAYEALSFGGYWAWDPVENMSLVPWLLLVAGIHSHLIAKNTGQALRATYLFYLFTFIMILYSTFLTRSGILGDSSVHAFTEMGLESQLILFIAAFLGLSLVLYFLRRKQIPVPEKEEPITAREFWMFIGSLILLFSSVIITVSTSLPVYNKIVQLFNPEYLGLTINDPIEHYNKYQLWIGVFIGLLTGIAQYLRYKEPNWPGRRSLFLKKMGISAVAAIAMSIATSFWIQLGAWQYWLLMFAGWFAVVANSMYIIDFLRKNLKAAGSALAHIGFGLMIVGIIASGLNKQHISSNPVVQRQLLDEELIQKNVLLFKGMPMFMSGYRVTYERDTMVGNLRKFTVRYQKLDDQGNVTEEFTVEPTATYDNKAIEVKAFNPSTKRYLDKDIFTHIATLPMKEANFQFAREADDSLDFQTYYLSQNESTLILDTVETKTGELKTLRTEARIVEVDNKPTHPDYKPEEGDYAIGVKVAFEKEDTTFFAEPVLVLRGELLYTYPVQLNDLSFKVRLTDEVLEKLIVNENDLDYRKFTVRQGDSFEFNGMQFQFNGFDQAAKHSGYQPQEGDIAINAKIDVVAEGKNYQARPLYLIRDNSVVNLKDEIPELGLHIRVPRIDPKTETVDIWVAQKEAALSGLPVQIAKKSFRTDYIVLEAIIFPGINLFWLGSTLMMVGLFLAMFHRLRQY